MANENYALSWDDEISFDSLPSRNFVTLEPGVYTGKVTKFERVVWSGSSKIPKGTATARITIEVNTDSGVAVFTDDLPLWASLEWKLSGMFVCFGLRKHGDPRGKMPWTEITGCTGTVQVGKREWTGKDGEPRYSNTVEKYIDPPATEVSVDSGEEFAF